MKRQLVSFIILAAGLGKRMKSSIPKALHLIAGKPIILHLLENIFLHRELCNLDQVVVVTGYKAELVENVVGRYSKEIKFVRQKNQVGTANAVKVAGSLFGENYQGNLAILCGDAPLLNIKDIIDFMNTKLHDNFGVIAFNTVNQSGYGRVIKDKNGLALKIVEEKYTNKEEKNCKLCNSGVLLGKAEYIFQFVLDIENNNIKKEKYLTDVIALANRAGKKVYILEAAETECKGINDRVALSMVEKDLQNTYRKKAMDNGATLVAPETVYFASDTVIGRDVHIGPNVFFGNGVTIEDEVIIHSFCHIEGVIIRAKAIIGPFARLRPDTIIGKGARIGNFVEIKKSTIGSGSKVNHLSYVGDSKIGENVNIGAGVITCNYDGKNKNVTSIGNGSFIGSNSSLVAPIKIGKNAIIGAGSVITDNVPDESLSVERSKQVTKINKTKNYFKKLKNKSSKRK